MTKQEDIRTLVKKICERSDENNITKNMDDFMNQTAWYIGTIFATNSKPTMALGAFIIHLTEGMHAALKGQNDKNASLPS